MPLTAQAADNPTVPQFSVQFIDNSYDVPPITTTSIDPYTGKEGTSTTPGYHVTDRKIELSIKNQPFTPYTDENNTLHELRYKIQYKGHFEEEWYHPMFVPTEYVIPSDTEYTVLSGLIWNIDYIVDGAQIDFKVEAILGHITTIPSDHWMFPDTKTFTPDISSGQNNIQTITIGKTTQTTTTPTPPPTSATFDNNNQPPQTPNQTQPPNIIFTIKPAIVVIGVLLVGVVVVIIILMFFRRPKNLKTPHFS